MTEELFLDSNQFNGTLNDCIGTKMHELKELNLFCNQFSGTIPSSIGQLKKLGKEYFLLIRTKTVSKYILTSSLFLFHGLTITELLGLEDNQLSGSVSTDICSLRSVHLTDLWADCHGSNPEVDCPADCCTKCCPGPDC